MASGGQSGIERGMVQDVITITDNSSQKKKPFDDIKLQARGMAYIEIYFNTCDSFRTNASDIVLNVIFGANFTCKCDSIHFYVQK